MNVTQIVLFGLGKKRYLFACVLAVVANLFLFSGPLLLKEILLYLEDEDDDSKIGYLWASLLFVCYFLRVFTLQNALHIVNEVSAKTANAMHYQIYSKILNLSSSSKKHMDTGKIMNLISSDSN